MDALGPTRPFHVASMALALDRCRPSPFLQQSLRPCVCAELRPYLCIRFLQASETHIINISRQYGLSLTWHSVESVIGLFTGALCWTTRATCCREHCEKTKCALEPSDSYRCMHRPYSKRCSIAYRRWVSLLRPQRSQSLQLRTSDPNRCSCTPVIPIAAALHQRWVSLPRHTPAIPIVAVAHQRSQSLQLHSSDPNRCSIASAMGIAA